MTANNSEIIDTNMADAQFLECMDTLDKLNNCKQEEIMNELQKYVVGRDQIKKKAYEPLSQGGWMPSPPGRTSERISPPRAHARV